MRGKIYWPFSHDSICLSFFSIFLIRCVLSLSLNITASEKTSNQEASVMTLPQGAKPAYAVKDMSFLSSNGLWNGYFEDMSCSLDEKNDEIHIRYSPVSLFRQKIFVGSFIYGQELRYMIPCLNYESGISDVDVKKIELLSKRKPPFFLLPYPGHSSAQSTVSDVNMKSEEAIFKKMSEAQRVLESQRADKLKFIRSLAISMASGIFLAVLLFIVYWFSMASWIARVIQTWRASREWAMIEKEIERSKKSPGSWQELLTLFKRLLKGYVPPSATVEEMMKKGKDIGIHHRCPSFQPLLELFSKEAYKKNSDQSALEKKLTEATELLFRFFLELKSHSSSL